MSAENVLRDELRSLLSQCTEPQVNMFNRMYGSVETIPFKKMKTAIDQCERTIAKNNSQQ